MKATLSFLAAAALLLSSCAPKVIEGVELYPAQGAKNINPDTHLVLRFAENPTVGNQGWIKVYDARTGEIVDSLDMSIPAGPTKSRTYGPDCDYAKVPYDYSRDFMATNRNTVPGTPSGTAEPTPPEYQLTIIGGFTDAFHFHPIIVHDNVATIYLHNNMLEYGKKYYVTIDEGVLNIADGSFKGVSKEDRWSFTTKSEAPQGQTLVVDASGAGDFNTVQGALDHIPDFCEEWYNIEVKAGDYEELVYARNKTHVRISGSGSDVTKVHYPNNEVFNPHPMTVKTNEWRGTFPSRRAAFMLDNCHDIVIEDIYIATDLRGQAEGLLLNGERIALDNVYIKGSGDALQANGTIYMNECTLDGDGDTILGRGSLFAYKSRFLCTAGPFSWVRNGADDHGNVFVECSFASSTGRPVDYGRTGTNHGTKYPHAEFVLINCRVKDIIPQGWSAIGEPSQKMYEFATRDLETGELVDVSKRHKYSRQLDAVKDAELIKNYSTPAFVLKGWNPEY